MFWTHVAFSWYLYTESYFLSSRITGCTSSSLPDVDTNWTRLFQPSIIKGCFSNSCELHLNSGSFWRQQETKFWKFLLPFSLNTVRSSFIHRSWSKPFRAGIITTTHSYRQSPKPHTSALELKQLSSRSGLKYFSVPDPCYGVSFSLQSNPSSQICTVPDVSSRILSSLKSQWIKFFTWRAARPLDNSNAM